MAKKRGLAQDIERPIQQPQAVKPIVNRQPQKNKQFLSQQHQQNGKVQQQQSSQQTSQQQQQQQQLQQQPQQQQRQQQQHQYQQVQQHQYQDQPNQQQTQAPKRQSQKQREKLQQQRQQQQPPNNLQSQTPKQEQTFSERVSDADLRKRAQEMDRQQQISDRQQEINNRLDNVDQALEDHDDPYDFSKGLSAELAQNRAVQESLEALLQGTDSPKAQDYLIQSNLAKAKSIYGAPKTDGPKTQPPDQVINTNGERAKMESQRKKREKWDLYQRSQGQQPKPLPGSQESPQANRAEDGSIFFDANRDLVLSNQMKLAQTQIVSNPLPDQNKPSQGQVEPMSYQEFCEKQRRSSGTLQANTLGKTHRQSNNATSEQMVSPYKTSHGHSQSGTRVSSQQVQNGLGNNAGNYNKMYNLQPQGNTPSKQEYYSSQGRKYLDTNNEVNSIQNQTQYHSVDNQALSSYSASQYTPTHLPYQNQANHGQPPPRLFAEANGYQSNDAPQREAMHGEEIPSQQEMYSFFLQSDGFDSFDSFKKDYLRRHSNRRSRPLDNEMHKFRDSDTPQKKRKLVIRTDSMPPEAGFPNQTQAGQSQSFVQNAPNFGEPFDYGAQEGQQGQNQQRSSQPVRNTPPPVQNYQHPGSSGMVYSRPDMVHAGQGSQAPGQFQERSQYKQYQQPPQQQNHAPHYPSQPQHIYGSSPYKAMLEPHQFQNYSQPQQQQNIPENCNQARQSHESSHYQNSQPYYNRSMPQQGQQTPGQYQNYNHQQYHSQGVTSQMGQQQAQNSQRSSVDHSQYHEQQRHPYANEPCKPPQYSQPFQSQCTQQQHQQPGSYQEGYQHANPFERRPLSQPQVAQSQPKYSDQQQFRDQQWFQNQQQHQNRQQQMDWQQFNQYNHQGPPQYPNQERQQNQFQQYNEYQQSQQQQSQHQQNQGPYQDQQINKPFEQHQGNQQQNNQQRLQNQQQYHDYQQYKSYQQDQSPYNSSQQGNFKPISNVTVPQQQQNKEAQPQDISYTPSFSQAPFQKDIPQQDKDINWAKPSNQQDNYEYSQKSLLEDFQEHYKQGPNQPAQQNVPPSAGLPLSMQSNQHQNFQKPQLQTPPKPPGTQQPGEPQKQKVTLKFRIGKKQQQQQPTQ